MRIGNSNLPMLIKMNKSLAIILALLLCVQIAIAQPVEKYGQLSVKGTQLVDKEGNAVVLRGVSYGWHNWWPRFYNAETVKWLKTDWHCSVVRAAMGIDPYGSYTTEPAKAIMLTQAVVDAAIAEGIYVIVDWHSHATHTREAVDFFSQMAKKYGKCPNIIWEIFNEPVAQPWPELKSYADSVIRAIRQFDPNNVILVGSSHWDQDIHLPAEDPIAGFSNIMYTVHFYAHTHKQWLRDRSDEAIKKGIPIFVSECAGVEASGDGSIDFEEWQAWIDWCEANKISWVVWSVSDKDEGCAFLLPSASSYGEWTDSDLTLTGKDTRERIIKYNK